jgi:hypothetical protein
MIGLRWVVAWLLVYGSVVVVYVGIYALVLSILAVSEHLSRRRLGLAEEGEERYMQALREIYQGLLHRPKVFLLLTGMFLAYTPAWSATYEAIDLGTFIPGAISKQGVMAGSIVHGGQFVARGTPGAIENLGFLGLANAQLGRVTVGYAGCFEAGCVNQEAMVWEGAGVAYPLGLLPHGNASAATDLNARGQICGYGDDATGRVRALRWSPNVTTLHDYGFNAYCDAINTAGFMVGSAVHPSGYLHAMLWVNPTVVYDLHGLIGGGYQSLGCCLTENFWMAGTMWTPTGMHAWRWPLWRGSPLMLPDPPGMVGCFARGLSDRGEVVGSCDPNLGYPAEHAILWDKDGQPHDLEALVVNVPGLYLDGATAINHAGAITAFSLPPRGWLLQPVEEVSER